ncbi:hypothetical protein Aduo_006679 [Ancylostoma duodenale]
MRRRHSRTRLPSWHGDLHNTGELWPLLSPGLLRERRSGRCRPDDAMSQSADHADAEEEVSLPYVLIR